MNLKITYYLDVISSWCYWAEPAWAELKNRYAKASVDFAWKLALLDESGMPSSREQEEWFYRRSGTVVRSPVMLNSGWFEPGLKEYLAPNLVAEAAKDFGVSDDRVRLAIAEAAVRQGKKVAQWEVSASAAATAAGLNAKALLDKAQTSEIEKRARLSTAEFHALQVTGRDRIHARRRHRLLFLENSLRRATDNLGGHPKACFTSLPARVYVFPPPVAGGTQFAR